MKVEMNGSVYVPLHVFLNFLFVDFKLGKIDFTLGKTEL